MECVQNAYLDVDKRIFLMLIPEHPTYDMAKQFQEEVNEKYQLYQMLPSLHITLESIFIENPEEEIKKVVGVIEEVCKQTEPFKIKVNGFACFGPPYKSVQLSINKTGPLIGLYNRIHTRLKEVGLKVKEYPDGIKFHMTIASPCFAEREWSEDEYNRACTELKSLSVHSGFLLKHLELWNPVVEEENKVIAQFWI